MLYFKNGTANKQFVLSSVGIRLSHQALYLQNFSGKHGELPHSSLAELLRQHRSLMSRLERKLSPQSLER